MNDPVVSVLMSVYNTPVPWLRNAIESICLQTFEDFEFIIVLDHPSDQSGDIVKEYAKTDNRIVVIENEENLGLTKSLNRGLAVAKGKYIARMDSDDIAFRHRFEEQVAYMENHPETVSLGTYVCTALNKEHAADKFPVSDWTPDQDVLKIRMLFRNVGISHPTAMIRRETMTAHGIQYDERIKKSQDYKLWIDMMPFGNIDTLKKVLLMYRVHGGQISADRKKQLAFVFAVAKEQAETLLGRELTEEEENIHSSIASIEVEDVKAYEKYIQMLIKANEEKKIYDQEKFVRELNYMWGQKAFRRVIRKKKWDMVFRATTLKILSPALLRYIKENKQIKKQRDEAIQETVFEDCPLRYSE